jgi:hypothetical protein
VFFSYVPKDIDKYNLYFAGISNRYRVKRVGKKKTGFFLRMVKFSFEETGDEFEISRDLLNFVHKKRVYKPQYMGIYTGDTGGGEWKGKRRIKKMNDEMQRIRDLDIDDPVEKWETEGGKKKL